MKWTLYLAALLGAILIPIRRTDVGKLQPIEVIALSEKNGTVRLETDTEDSGEGYTIEEAVADLKQTTPGVVYLDIAEYLLLEPGCEEHLDELQVWLKGSTLVCMKEGTMDLKDAAKYLNTHKPKAGLKEVNAGVEPEILVMEEEKMYLKKK